MIGTKEKIADAIYSQMLLKNPASIAPLAYGMSLWMNRAEEDVSNQILGLAATLICMLQKYDLNLTDVLGTAESIVFSDKYNNMQPVFKTIMESLKSKEEILN